MRKFSSRGTGGLNRHPMNESVPISYVIYHMSFAIGSKRGWGAMGGARVVGRGEKPEAGLMYCIRRKFFSNSPTPQLAVFATPALRLYPGN